MSQAVRWGPCYIFVGWFSFASLETDNSRVMFFYAQRFVVCVTLFCGLGLCVCCGGLCVRGTLNFDRVVGPPRENPVAIGDTPSRGGATNGSNSIYVRWDKPQVSEKKVCPATSIGWKVTPRDTPELSFPHMGSMARRGRPARTPLPACTPFLAKPKGPPFAPLPHPYLSFILVVTSMIVCWLLGMFTEFDQFGGKTQFVRFDFLFVAVQFKDMSKIKIWFVVFGLLVFLGIKSMWLFNGYRLC